MPVHSLRPSQRAGVKRNEIAAATGCEPGSRPPARDERARESERQRLRQQPAGLRGEEREGEPLPAWSPRHRALQRAVQIDTYSFGLGLEARRGGAASLGFVHGSGSSCCCPGRFHEPCSADATGRGLHPQAQAFQASLLRHAGRCLLFV